MELKIIDKGSNMMPDTRNTINAVSLFVLMSVPVCAVL